MSEPDVHVEIERKYLLRACPTLPAGSVPYAITQGYLPEAGRTPASARAPALGGRLRRTRGPDGVEVFLHTVKSGHGRCRTERERTMDAVEFRRHWPDTTGRRLSKTRHRTPPDERGLVWEIDVFERWDLVLAEIELPAAETAVRIPAWLAPHVVREVTDDPAYANSALAIAGPPPGG